MALVWVLVCCSASGGCESLIGLEERTFRADAGGEGGGGGNGGGDASVPDGGGDASAPDGGDASAPDGGDASVPDAGGDAGVDAGPGLDCGAYCSQVSTACRGQDQVYASDAECLAVCEQFPVGNEAEPTGNTLACRMDQAQKAAEAEPEVHCAQAGPTGGGVCGEACASYCMLSTAFCEPNAGADSEAECQHRCGGLRDLAGELALRTYSVGRDARGDTLQCRFVQLAANAPAGAEDTCFGAQIAPRADEVTNAENPCLRYEGETEPRCEDYCALVMWACVEGQAVYESAAQCLAVCDALELGTIGQDSGNDTVGCRKTHSYNALVIDPDPHCPHSGPGGAGVCGEDCDGYCRMLQAGCPAEFEATHGTGSGGFDACLTECNSIRPSPVQYSVQTADDPNRELACRMLYAARAVTNPTASLCQSALGDGNCTP